MIGAFGVVEGSVTMRRFLLAAVVFGTMAGAHAADMPDYLRGGLAEPTPTRNWDGWYAGGQVGYSSANMDFSQSLVGLTNFIYRDSVLEEPTSQLSALGKANPQATGFGAFVGRNYQWDDIVVGIEANYNYINGLTGSSTSSIGPLEYSFPPGQFTPLNDTPTFAVTLSGKAAAQIKDAITFRGRAGWATGNFLPYIFGGIAVGRMSRRPDEFYLSRQHPRGADVTTVGAGQGQPPSDRVRRVRRPQLPMGRPRFRRRGQLQLHQRPHRFFHVFNWAA